MAKATPGDRVPFATLVAAHGPAAQGCALVLMAVLCLLPLPGAGTLLSLGLAGWAWSLWRHGLVGSGWAVPALLSGWTLQAHTAQRLLNRLARLHACGRKWSRPRWERLATANHQRVWAAWVLSMAFLIFLPVPLGNVLPAAALVCLGLGLVYRDGLWSVLALGVGAVAWLVVGGLAYGAYGAYGAYVSATAATWF
jgi:hypothetical protein